MFVVNFFLIDLTNFGGTETARWACYKPKEENQASRLLDFHRVAELTPDAIEGLLSPSWALNPFIGHWISDLITRVYTSLLLTNEARESS